MTLQDADESQSQSRSQSLKETLLNTFCLGPDNDSASSNMNPAPLRPPSD
jgi:hypothetical protein